MKERMNISLKIHELTLGSINLDGIKNPWLKLIPAFLMFPFQLLFVFLALCIEEPIKCAFAIICMQSSPKEAWIYYKKCWSSLLGGMRVDNQN